MTSTQAGTFTHETGLQERPPRLPGACERPAPRKRGGELAERGGFEPPVTNKGHAGFRNRSDQPLWHLSARLTAGDCTAVGTDCPSRSRVPARRDSRPGVPRRAWRQKRHQDGLPRSETAGRMQVPACTGAILRTSRVAPGSRTVVGRPPASEDLLRLPPFTAAEPGGGRLGPLPGKIFADDRRQFFGR